MDSSNKLYPYSVIISHSNDEVILLNQNSGYLASSAKQALAIKPERVL